MTVTEARLYQPGGTTPEGTIELGLGYPDLEIVPSHLLTLGFLTQAARRREALSYGEPYGSARLIAQLRATLLRAEPLGGTLLTNGSMEALDLFIRREARRGGILAAEDPVFPGLVSTAAIAGLCLVGVPVDDDGIRPDVLEDFIRRRGVTAVYVMPTGANPTGTVMPLARRLALLDVAVRAGVTIVEDDAYAHLVYDDAVAPPSLHSLAPDVVINVRSLSKLLFPGVRLAAVIGPEAVLDEFVALKPVGGTTPFGSQVIAAMLEELAYAPFVAGLRERYEARRDVAVTALAKAVPNGVFRTPAAGFFLWVRIPGLDATALHQMAAASGVAILPGPAFTINEDRRDYFRISFSFETSEHIAEGIAVLSGLIQAL